MQRWWWELISGYLDEDTRRKVLIQLSEYLKETSRSIIIATNEKIFLEASNQILFMERGRLVSQGKLYWVDREYDI